MAKVSTFQTPVNELFLCVCLCFQAVYTASIPEDLPVNSLLLTVGATDADVGVNAQIQYSLHGSQSQDFSMDPDTGMEAKLKSLCDRLNY